MCIFLSQVLILPFHEIGHLVANSNLPGVGPQASLWEEKKKKKGDWENKTSLSQICGIKGKVLQVSGDRGVVLKHW